MIYIGDIYRVNPGSRWSWWRRMTNCHGLKHLCRVWYDP